MIPLFAPGFSLFEQNIPLAIAIVVASSFLFAGGSTVQHLAVGRTVDKQAENRSMGLGQLWRLIRTPLWLLGLLMIFVGASTHIVGLMLAPVTVVQPVGILAVPWSVLLASWIHKHKISRQMWGAVAMTIAGIVGFTLVSTSTAAKHTVLDPVWITVGCVLTYAIGGTLGLFGARGPARLRCLMWASGGSFFYGLSSALIKTTSELIRQGDFVGKPIFWVVVPFLVGSYAIGGFMVQQGFANGPAEITVGSMTTTDPIVGVSFGLIILGEGANIGPLAGVAMAVAGAFAIAGVFVLSRHHPDAHPAIPHPLTAGVD
jgi:drug/metabolite transporter (DMT)-like permease